jgi:rhamnose utilization protein RhaD (predicted bifunctional aldolase and dehydrogenase)
VCSGGSISEQVQSKLANGRRQAPGTTDCRYPSRWNEQRAAALTPLERLVYRSNLLGPDRRLANWGGANNSSKLEELDHLGRDVRVLRVKGSGTDLATIGAAGFAGLRLDELRSLRGRAELSNAAMVDHLRRSAVQPSQPRPSIETLLHALLPARCVDHTHPDAIIALTCSPRGHKLAAEAFGEEGVWIDYIRPGFALSKLVAERLEAAAQARFVLLAKHGLVTWGDSDRECYEATLEAAERAAAVLEAAAGGEPLGPAIRPALAGSRRRALLAGVSPVLRGAISRERRHVLEVDDGDAVPEFVGAAATPEVSQVGGACPDHLIHTKARPLVLDCAGKTADVLAQAVRDGIAAYEHWYGRYYESHWTTRRGRFRSTRQGRGWC